MAVFGQVQYAFTNFAGQPGVSGMKDGLGGAARFGQPNGVAVDNAGNVYVADAPNCTIRKVSAAGEVTTLAGDAAYRDPRRQFDIDPWEDMPMLLAPRLCFIGRWG